MKFGILGAGGQAQLHAEALANMDDTDLVAVAAAHADTAARFADRFDTAALTGLAAMLDMPGIDAVIIATPANLHAEQVTAALAAGLHVLCEVPVAWKLDHVDQMLDAADKAGRLFRPAFIHRFDAELQMIAREIKDGMIGELRTISTRRQSFPDWLKGQAVHESHYGDAIHELLYFDLDAFNWFLGGTPDVIGATGIRTGDAFTQISALFRYEEVSINAEASQLLPEGFPFTIWMELVGTRGQIELGYRFPKSAPPEITFRLRDAKGIQDLEVSSQDPFMEQISCFVRDCARTEGGTIEPYAAKDVLELALAVEVAAKRNR